MKKFSDIKNDKIDIDYLKLNSELLFISENDKQVGSLILCYSADGKASVFSVAVLEKFRGKGYSKQLMNKAIDRAKEKGCILMELNTEVTNEVANNLYQNMGFELKGLLDDYNNYQLFL
jgi:ribosomal protein S18 acetylase RimI-like enzyme